MIKRIERQSFATQRDTPRRQRRQPIDAFVDDLNRGGRCPTRFSGLADALRNTVVTETRSTGQLEARAFVPEDLAWPEPDESARDFAARIVKGLAPSHVRVLFDGPDAGDGLGYVKGTPTGYLFGVVMAVSATVDTETGYAVDPTAPDFRVVLLVPQQGAAPWRIETLPQAVSSRLGDLFRTVGDGTAYDADAEIQELHALVAKVEEDRDAAEAEEERLRARVDELEAELADAQEQLLEAGERDGESDGESDGEG